MKQVTNLVSATDWFIKGSAMCNYVYVIMHVKDPQLSVTGVEHCVLVAGFCLSLYNLHMLNKDINMIQSICIPEAVNYGTFFSLSYFWAHTQSHDTYTINGLGFEINFVS